MKKFTFLLLFLSSLHLNATTYFFTGDWATGTWTPSYPGTTINVGDVVVADYAAFQNADVTINGTLTLSSLAVYYANTLYFGPNAVLNIPSSGVLNYNSLTVSPTTTINAFGSIYPQDGTWNGNLTVNSKFDPSVYPCIVNGNLTLNTTSNTQFDHYFDSSVSTNGVTGLVTVNGDVTINNALFSFLVVINAPPLGEEHILIQANSVTGTFNRPPILFSNGNYGNLYYTATEVRLKIESFALPLELTSFNAIQETNANKITWTTALESNLQNFEIERSEDGKKFSTIGTLSATNRANNYTFFDKEKNLNTVYYRLKTNELDNTFSYSKTVALSPKKQPNTKGFSIFPTFVENTLHIKTLDKQRANQVKIIKLTGETVFAQSITNDWESLDVTALASGAYIIHIQNEDENPIFIEKFIKM